MRHDAGKRSGTAEHGEEQRDRKNKGEMESSHGDGGGGGRRLTWWVALQRGGSKMSIGDRAPYRESQSPQRHSRVVPAFPCLFWVSSVSRYIARYFLSTIAS